MARTFGPLRHIWHADAELEQESEGYPEVPRLELRLHGGSRGSYEFVNLGSSRTSALVFEAQRVSEFFLGRRRISGLRVESAEISMGRQELR